MPRTVAVPEADLEAIEAKGGIKPETLQVRQD
jgi:hypothetical protein